MRLSGLGAASASVSAAANLPGAGAASGALNAAATTDPAAAISAGSTLFDGAYQKAGGSITGTIAVAASIVGDLPAGQAKDMLNQVMGIAEGAAAGAAMGSIVPGWGTAVGAAVGAIMGMVDSMTSDPTPAPAGDYRSTAEQYVFPAVPATPVDTDPQSLLAATSAQPYCWPDIRIHSAMYQVPIDETDPGSNQGVPQAATFGTSWVSPPQTTPTSKAAAWYLAQAWLGTDEVTKQTALYTGSAPNANQRAGGVDQATLNSAVQANRIKAGTLLGSDELVTKALSYVSRWYGTSFERIFSFPANKTTKASKFKTLVFSVSQCPGVNSNWGWTLTKAASGGVHGGSSAAEYNAAFKRIAIAWADLAHCLNENCSLDYAYYWSETLMIAQNQPSQWGGVVNQVVPVYGQQFLLESGTFFMAAPDTTLVGLCELAALIVTGVLPSAGSDHVALHYVMALAWLWRRGQEQDAHDNLPYGIVNHRNFSRIIGRLSVMIYGTPADRAKAKATATAKAKKATATSTKAKATAAASAERVMRLGDAATASAAAPSPSRVQTTLTTPAPSRWVGDLAKTLLVSAAGAAVVTYLRRKRS